MILMGKHKPTYTRHVDTGDCVVVLNCSKLEITGKKLEQTTYDRYSGYPGGLHRVPRERIFRDHPEQLMTHIARASAGASTRAEASRTAAQRGTRLPSSAELARKRLGRIRSKGRSSRVKAA